MLRSDRRAISVGGLIRRFPDTDAGREAKDSFTSGLTDVRVVYDVRTRIAGVMCPRPFVRGAVPPRAHANRVEGRKLDNAAVDPRHGREQFSEAYAERWIASRLVNGRPLSEMTKRGYRSLLHRHILPTFGGVALGAIDRGMVEAWYADVATDYSQDAAAKSYRLLRAILSTAVEHRRIAANPCQIKGGGTEHREERPLVDTATVLRLAEGAKPPYLRTLILLAAFGGLRTGECLGLRRCDVDLLHHKVFVRQQVHEVKGRGRTTVERAKSEAGRREVVLPTIVVEALQITSIGSPDLMTTIWCSPVRRVDPSIQRAYRRTGGRPARKPVSRGCMSMICVTTARP